MEWDTTQSKGVPKKSFKARIKNELLSMLDKKHTFLWLYKLFKNWFLSFK